MIRTRELADGVQEHHALSVFLIELALWRVITREGKFTGEIPSAVKLAARISLEHGGRHAGTPGTMNSSKNSDQRAEVRPEFAQSLSVVCLMCAGVHTSEITTTREIVLNTSFS